jgi:hypothetical protein
MGSYINFADASNQNLFQPKITKPGTQESTQAYADKYKLGQGTLDPNKAVSFEVTRNVMEGDKEKKDTAGKPVLETKKRNVGIFGTGRSKDKTLTAGVIYAKYNGETPTEFKAIRLDDTAALSKAKNENYSPLTLKNKAGHYDTVYALMDGNTAFTLLGMSTDSNDQWAAPVIDGDISKGIKTSHAAFMKDGKLTEIQEPDA